MLDEMFSKSSIKDLTLQNNVQSIKMLFTDMDGLLKGIDISISQLNKALNNEVMIDGSSISGFSSIESSDLYLYPDLSTFKILPWNSFKGKIAIFICDVYTASGECFEGDPRGRLEHAIDDMKSLGFSSFNLGAELEFFLFQKNEKGEILKDLADDAAYFEQGALDIADTCREEIVESLESLGYEIEAFHHEVAKGQHEINFKYSNVLEACDKIQLFKYVVKFIANKYNLHATFMPKPVFGINGSGMHCNMSLFSGKENSFYDKAEERGLSSVAYAFLAGILYHSKGFSAITNPLVNSYKRLVPGYEAPVYIAWSRSNRSTLVRIPSTRGLGTRLELRSVDPSANPYLSSAVLLASGLDGIKNNFKISKEVNINLYKSTQEQRDGLGIANLPESLKESLDYLKNDKLILAALGKHISSKFITAKTKEWIDYSRYVSDWEIQKYLKLF
ncbi:MAG: type I glutamate--ammonia ligase [Psittacicella sp.]